MQIVLLLNIIEIAYLFSPSREIFYIKSKRVCRSATTEPNIFLNTWLWVTPINHKITVSEHEVHDSLLYDGWIDPRSF